MSKRNYRKKRSHVNDFIDENQRVHAVDFDVENYTPDSSNNALGYFKIIHDLKLDRLKSLSNGKRVLDIGCGAGIYLLPLLESGINVYGCDYVQKFVEKTQSLMLNKADKNRIVNANAIDLKSIYADNSFDMAFSISAFPYMREWRQVLSETSRILKESGITYIEFGNPISMNTIKAKHLQDKLILFDEPKEKIFEEFYKNKLRIVAVRMSQLFPMYLDIADKKEDAICSHFLRKYMAKIIEGESILDELVSSVAVNNQYAYRMTIIAVKNSFGKIEKFKLQGQLGDPSKWSSNNIEFDFDSMRIDPLSCISRLAQCLIIDPTDAVAVYGIMKCHGDDYKDLAEQYLDDARKIYGNNIGPRKKGQIQNKLISKKADVQYNGVSVVLPTYNNIEMLPNILNSLNVQTLKDFEFIIVNDGSSDGTKEFLDNLKMRDGISLKIIHQQNMKLPGALNSGFYKSTGNFLTWVSSDCICHPNMLWSLASTLNNHPEVGVVYSSFFIIDRNGWIINKISHQNINLRNLIIRNNGNASFMYTRKAALQTGIYDERLNGAEDWDYWIRMAENFMFAYLNEALYYYRDHEGSMQSTIRPEIDEHCEATINKYFQSIGNKLDIRMLYPSVNFAIGDAQKRIITEAQLDFGTRCIASRTRSMQGMAEMFLDEVIKSSEDSVLQFKATVHKILFLAITKPDIEKMTDIACEIIEIGRRIISFIDEKEKDILIRYGQTLTKFIETKDISVLNNLFPLWTSTYGPLFEYDRHLIVEA